jgi:hypothetical protein
VLLVGLCLASLALEYDQIPEDNIGMMSILSIRQCWALGYSGAIHFGSQNGEKSPWVIGGDTSRFGRYTHIICINDNSFRL